jgi:hypothetical protein
MIVANLKIPCQDCLHKYQCDEKRLACAQFRYFVNTGYVSEVAQRTPTRKIYAEIFYKEPIMPKKETTI